MFTLFRLCRKDEIPSTLLAKTATLSKSTFDFVEVTFVLVERIVRLVAFDNVASTLLLVWTGL